jgi:integrase
MASIANDPNGRKRILFIGADGQRRAIRLGKVSVRDAESFRTFIEKIVAAARLNRHPDEETINWIAKLDAVMHARLYAVGLAEPRIEGKASLGPFIDGFIERCTTAKANTLTNMKQVRRWLVKHFGEHKDMRKVTAADAEDWRHYMVTEGLGENTIRRHIGRARQLWKSAARRGIVRGPNPFEGMVATVRADKTRQFFVTREMADAVIAKAPNTQWKLMIALSRYGGLRCPSEHLALKWGDVDWEHNRILVHSPKTEHHEGKGERMIPLFPELRPYLLEAFEQAEEGEEHVITRYRDAAANLRTHFSRIIRKAGYEPWAKPWHNLRASCQTELARKYPIHVVCAWIGNSRAVAQEHYLQVTDEDFAAAMSTEAAQKAAQHTAESTRTNRKSRKRQRAGKVQNPSDFPSDSDKCGSVPKVDKVVQHPRQDSNL